MQTSGYDISWLKATVPNGNAIVHAYISSPLKGNLSRVMHVSPNQRHCFTNTSAALLKARPWIHMHVPVLERRDNGPLAWNFRGSQHEKTSRS